MTAPGPVFNLMADIGFTSVALNWGVPEIPNGVIISYEVTFRVGKSELVIMNTTEVNLTIPELTPRTTLFNISVTAFTSAGQGIPTTHLDVVIPPLRESWTNVVS